MNYSKDKTQWASTTGDKLKGELYEAPAIYIINIAVEKGFAASQDTDPSDWIPGHNDWFD